MEFALDVDLLSCLSVRISKTTAGVRAEIADDREQVTASVGHGCRAFPLVVAHVGEVVVLVVSVGIVVLELPIDILIALAEDIVVVVEVVMVLKY